MERDFETSGLFPFLKKGIYKMSYEILKYASFNKKEKKITVTAAANNIRPLYYSKYEYAHKDMTFEQNIEYFFVSMLEGNYKGGQKKIREIYGKLLELKDYAKAVDYNMDSKLKTGYENGLNHLVAKIYAVPVVLKQDFDMAHIIETIYRHNDAAVAGYKAKEKEYADKGWLFTGACSQSDIFPGWNVYQVRDSKDLLLAEHSCYEQAKGGFCNSKAGRVIRIDGSYGDLFDLLSIGYDMCLNEKNFEPSFINQAKNLNLWKLFSGIDMGKLPYPNFPWEEYGFKRYTADETSLKMEA